jgi:hypothetical protein
MYTTEDAMVLRRLLNGHPSGNWQVTQPHPLQR